MITADGYFEGVNHELSWHNVDAEFNDFAIAQLEEADTLIFGRKTYDMMAAFWPTEPAKKNDPEVAEKMNTKSKLVFSHTLSGASWQNTTVISDSSLDQLRKFKEMPGKSLLILGSSNLCVSLLKAALIDELRIMVNPTIIGKGTPLFVGLSSPIRLQLSGNQVFRSGNVLLRYSANNTGE